jgi:hypothetical protein
MTGYDPKRLEEEGGPKDYLGRRVIQPLKCIEPSMKKPRIRNITVVLGFVLTRS